MQQATLKHIVNESIEQLEARRLLASPELLLDIEAGAASSFPDQTVALGDIAIFPAHRDPEFGLWRSDGTPGGTQQIGPDGLLAERIIPLGAIAVFYGRDAAHGFELWKTDGTDPGTQLVEDINPGPGDTGIFPITAVSGIAYFAIPAPGLGVELWRSDGTEEGTHVLRDIIPGEGSSSPTVPLGLNGALVFGADNGEHGRELWISDGTADGTRMLVDVVPGPEGSNPVVEFVDGSILYFSAETELGRELWKTDGTPQGTQLVKDINPGAAGSGPGSFARAGDTIIFRAADAEHGPELWRTDGTAEGTQLVRDLRPGAAGSGIATGFANLVSTGQTAYFRADDGVHGVELWKSDGTTSGTTLVRDISSGSSNPNYLALVGETLYFAADHPASGNELWSSDGTLAGTQLVEDIRPGSESSNPNQLAAVGTRLHFDADDGEHGFEPWVLNPEDDGGGGGGGDGDATIDFESLPLGFIDSGVYEEDGFVFANVPGDGGSPTDRLRVDGTNQGYEGQILTTYNWARRLLVSREDGAPFSVERFDYAAGRWNEPGDFVLTGRFADGSVETRTISFSNRDLVTLELNWQDVVSFDLNAAGGVNNAYFAVDNFVFNTPEEEGPPFLTGSLEDPDPVAGPARLRFDERTWHEIDDLVELPGGAFYAFGHSGVETWDLPRVPPIERVEPTDITHWLTRHLPDGTIDRSFGDNGRMAVADLPWDGRGYALELTVGNRLIGQTDDGGAAHIALFDLELERDTSFGDGGILVPAADGQPLSGFSVEVFEDGGLAVVGSTAEGEAVLQVYSPAGALVRSAALEPILDAALPDDSGGGGFDVVGEHDGGFIYFGVLKVSGDSSDPDPEQRPFVGVLRLTSELVVDSAYGDGGLARDTGIFPIEGLSTGGFFAGADGRALIEVREADGDRNFSLFGPEGQPVANERYYSSPGFSGESFARLVNVNFLPAGDVAIAFWLIQVQSSHVVESLTGPLSTGFEVTQFDYGEPSGGRFGASFLDPELPNGLSDAIPTAGGGFILGGFLEDVEFLAEADPQVIDIDHVGGLWHVDFAT